MVDEPGMPQSNPLERGILNYYAENGFSLGGVDLFCLGRMKASKAATLLLTMVGGAVYPETGGSPFARVIIAYPATAIPAEAAEKLLTSIRSQVAKNQTKLPVGVEPADWVTFEPLDLRAERLAELADALPPHSALIVLRAADFRVEGLQAADLGAAAVPEDVWVPQIHHLAQVLLEISARRSMPIILEAGQFLPGNDAHRALLRSLDGIGLLGAEASAVDTYVAQNIARWDGLLVEGRVGDVLSELDNAKDWPAREREVYRLQVLYRAGLYGPTIEAIENLPYIDELPAPMKLRLARIASACGALALAGRLLRLALPRLTTVEELLTATTVADEIDDDQSRADAEARLAEIFPGHGALVDRRRVRLRAEGHFEELADDLEATDPEDAAYYRALAEEVAELTSYDQAMATLTERCEGRANDIRFLLARHAMQANAFVDAAALLLRGGEQERRHINLLIDVMEGLVLRQRGEGDRDLILESLRATVAYLSAHPDQPGPRVRLERLFSFETTGYSGRAYLAFVTQSLLSRPLDLVSDETLVGGEMAFDETFSLDQIRPAAEWLHERGAVLIGQVTIPRELLPNDADQLAVNLLKLIEMTASRASDEGDVKAINLLLSLLAAINPHTRAQTYDLAAARLAAAGYISAGHSQQARDLAEQVLRMSGQTGRRKRQAWFAFADVYLRTGSHIESLVGFACAAAGDTQIDGDAAWAEMNGVARLFRELGLLELARQVHNGATAILRRLGAEDANAHRTRLFALYIDFTELASTPAPSAAAITDLLARATTSACEAINDHPDPAIVLLAQTIALANANEVPVCPAAQEAVDALLPSASRRAAILARGYLTSRVDSASLFALYTMQEAARYAEDAGFDARNLALLAERMLWNEGDDLDATMATFLTELLADRAIPLPGWESTSRPVPSLANVGEPAAIAAAISSEAAVIALGLDGKGHLVRTSWFNGAGSFVRESRDTFSSAALAVWKERFPFEYGVDDGATANLFFTSTEQLKLSALPEGPIMVVADSRLQIFPVNLLRVGDAFAGQTRPISSVPSLSWLKAARANTAKSDGRLKAWISSRTENGMTLAMVAERLAETFENHGVQLDQSDQLPEHFAGAELAVVTAHGSLGDSSQFQRVRDEGDLVVSAAELASKLRNVRVVILFVCSAGRADQVPGAATTFGLAKKVLERGASAVVASPWPLDSRVTYHWLPTFLDEWTNGRRLDEAVFAANRAVGDGLGYAPETSLALSLYGDPGLEFSGVASPRETDPTE